MDPSDWYSPIFTPFGWLSIAAITAGLEILLPGAFMIWLSAAALATAVATVLLGLGVGWQLVAFSVFALASVLASRRIKLRNPIVSDDPKLNKRGLRMIGQYGTVTVALVNGEGRVKLGDSEWGARGPDADVGSRVRIRSVEGTTLIVDQD